MEPSTSARTTVGKPPDTCWPPGSTRKRVRVYGITRKEALAKLTEKIAASNLGLPVAAADSTVSACLTYWLDGCRRSLPAGDHPHPLRRVQPPPPYVHSVLKSTPEHAVREDELPRNVARNVKTAAPRPQTLPAPHRRRSPAAPPGSRRRPSPRPVRTRPTHRTPQGRTPRPPLGRPRPRRRHRRHPPLPPAHPKPGSDRPEHQDPGLRAPHRRPHRVHQLSQDLSGTAAGRAPGGRNGLDGQRPRLHHLEGQATRPHQPHPPLPPPPPQRRTPDHPLPRSPALDRHPWNRASISS